MRVHRFKARKLFSRSTPALRVLFLGRDQLAGSDRADRSTDAVTDKQQHHRGESVEDEVDGFVPGCGHRFNNSREMRAAQRPDWHVRPARPAARERHASGRNELEPLEPPLPFASRG